MRLRFVIVLMVCAAIAGRPARPQQAAKPMTKDQVMSVVSAGMDDAELAKKIEERGIDFDLTDDYLQALRKAGAQEVVIKALRTVKPSPMGRDQLLLLVAGGVPSERAMALVKQRGVDFIPDEKFLESLRTAGADDSLIAVVREVKPAGVEQHLARAAECERTRAWAEAEQEYRAALAIVPGTAEFIQRAELAAKHLKPPQYRLTRTLKHAGEWFNFVGSRMVISPDGRWLGWSDEKGLDVWELATGEKKPSPHGKDMFAFSPDGRWLAAIAKDFKGVGVWEVATGREGCRLPTEDPIPGFSVQFSPDGHLLAIGGLHGRLNLWEFPSGKQVLSVAAMTDTNNVTDPAWVVWIAFSPDGRSVASRGDNNTIKLWETASGREVRTLAGLRDAPYHAAFSPDGRLLASSSRDGIKLWDVSTGQVVRGFDESARYSGYVTFTPDGDWLAFGSGGLTLWEVGTGRKVMDLEGPRWGIGALGFSTDGKWLAATSDTEVYLWQRQD
jgi:WD40 repeat protein